jgi:hypothetical protein
MSNVKLRIKLLKLAELSGVVYSDSAVNQIPNLGAPPTFIASDKYPFLRKVFSNEAISSINQLSSFINNALFYASNGEYDMNKLFNIAFNYSASNIPTSARDLRLLLLFAKNIFTYFYNNGTPYQAAVNRQQYLEKIDQLLKSPNLENLARLNPSSQMAVKLGTNIKTKIVDTLNFMKTIAPTK